MLAKIVLLSCVLAGVKAKDDSGVKYLMRVYEDCSKADGLMPCLKKKAILFFDRAARMESIPLIEGVDVVKIPGSQISSMSENEIDAALPRSLDEKDAVLTDMLWDRIASFANSRTIQLSLPKMSGEELGRGMVEGLLIKKLLKKKKGSLISKKGRGKMKKMMGMMMMGAAMKMIAMTPLAIAGLFILAGKALIVAKIALLLSGIMVLKKLMGAKGGGGGGGHDSGHSHGAGGGYSGGGWQSGGSSGGWDRRALEPSDLAYEAYKRD